MAEKVRAERPKLADVVKALGFDNYSIEALVDHGGWRPVRCPFHDDRSPSASANVSVDAFKCFSCDIMGDSWSLICHFKTIPKDEFRRAVDWAEANVGFAGSTKHKVAATPYVSPWASEEEWD